MKPAMYRRNSWLPTGGWFPTVLDEWLNTDVMNSANNVAPSVNVKENQNSYVVELRSLQCCKLFYQSIINHKRLVAVFAWRLVFMLPDALV